MTEIALPGFIDADYALEVADDSMHTFGIHAGDMALICAQDFATSGDFVVLMQGDSAFLRRYTRCGDLDVYTPGHPGIPSIIAGEDSNVQVVGKVSGIFRLFDREEDLV